MAKLMSNRELELFRMAINLREQVECCCPEVGMGPSRQTLAEELAGKLSFAVHEDDVAEAAETAAGS